VDDPNRGRDLLMRIANAFVFLDFLDKFGTVGLRYPENFL
jgi:hypothetical protein